MQLMGKPVPAILRRRTKFVAASIPADPQTPALWYYNKSIGQAGLRLVGVRKEPWPLCGAQVGHPITRPSQNEIKSWRSGHRMALRKLQPVALQAAVSKTVDESKPPRKL